MPSVEVFHWNPHRPRFQGRYSSRIRATAPVNNFGDLLGPLLVDRIRAELGLSGASVPDPARLLSIGSILHFARPGDVVWGSGINGKIRRRRVATPLDVRAVRGPRTRQRLLKRGVAVPEVFGDPALLWTSYWPREHYLRGRAPRGVGIVPNLNDWTRFAKDRRSINPRQAPHRVIEEIARCEFVVGSSLHGVVLAEAMGIPSRFLSSAHEHPFKYRDYLLGTGRGRFRPAETVAEAVRAGAQPALDWNPSTLRDAFPADLWGGAVPAAEPHAQQSHSHGSG